MSGPADQDATRSKQSSSSGVDRPLDLGPLDFRLSEEAVRAIGERYELLHFLGRGGMGLVYKARDHVSGDIVALKVINPEIASSPHVIERFKAELRLARKITHKNVCRVHDLSQFGSIHVLSMEYVEGETLRQILRRDETLSLRHGLRLMRQVIDALEEAHRQGVAHRDLKPENILVSNDGTVKVMDFGLARSLSDDTTSTVPGTVLGTPAYMSPEQAAGRPADQRSDIYALGLMLYEMFTGRRAFEAETSVALVAKHIHETPSRPTILEPDLPQRIEAAILRCLEKEPKKRFSSVRELEAALVTRGALDLQTPPLSGLVEPPARLGSWHRRDWLLISAGILCIAGFFVIFDLVFPYHSFQLEISNEEAISKAREVVRHYLPELTDSEATARAEFVNQLSEYPGTRLSLGLEKMQEQYQALAKSWNVRVFHPGRDIYSARLEYDIRGRLIDAVLNQPLRGPEVRPSTPEEIIEFSQHCAKDLFGMDVSAIQPVEKHTSEEMNRTFSVRSPPWLWFNVAKGVPNVAWTLPSDPPGTLKYLIIAADRGRLYSASIARDPAFNYGTALEMEAYRRACLLGISFVTLFALLAVCLSVVRRLYLHTDPAVLAISALIAISLPPYFLGRVNPGDSFWIELLVAFGVLLGISYLALASPHDYFVRTFPALAKSFLHLLRLRLTEQTIGFSILRGCALGWLFLIGQTVTLWVLGKSRLGAPSASWLAFFVNNQTDVLSYVLLAVSASIIAAWLLLALPLSLLHRMGASVRTRLVSVGLLWTAAAATLPGASVHPFWLIYIFAPLQGALLAFILLNWDWLTCATAIFTVEAWLIIYPAYRIFSQIDGLKYALGLLPWIAVFMLGMIIPLRPWILASWRRLKVILE
jgi:serine/threonine protein kinase